MSNQQDLLIELPFDFLSDEYQQYARRILGKGNEISWSSATLCLLVSDKVFFIDRSASVPTHKSQIAFPGGHKEQGESDPWDTASREFEEEIGVDRCLLQKVGYLAPVVTSGGKLTIPCVARLNDVSLLYWRDLGFQVPMA